MTARIAHPVPSGRECAWCHGPLLKGRRGFCSDACRKRVRRAEQRAAKRCAWCGGPVPVPRRRFCSDLCSIRGQKKERVFTVGNRGRAIVAHIRKMAEHANGDIDALRWLDAAAKAARETLTIAVDDCRAHGYSDAEIGQALGITRQAVGQRFGRKREVHAGQPESRAGV